MASDLDLFELWFQGGSVGPRKVCATNRYGFTTIRTIDADVEDFVWLCVC